MCHVLIIEDDAIAAMDIQETLKRAGATSFSVAETEGDAVLSARARPPALITSDVMLARGSGPAAVRAIEDELGPRPVIFITATPDQCANCNGHPILEKPFGAGRLAAVFKAATADPPSTPRLEVGLAPERPAASVAG